jgi:hypothetical protein
VAGGKHVFFNSAELLIQLFAGPGADEFDRDVKIWTQSRQKNEIASQIDDPYGIAHIEHKISPPFRMVEACSNSWHASGMIMK